MNNFLINTSSQNLPNVDKSALEDFGYFIGQLYLSMSPLSACLKRSTLLKHVDQSFREKIVNELSRLFEDILEETLYFIFDIADILGNPETLQVFLIGRGRIYKNAELISLRTEAYLFSFSRSRSKLLLSDIRLVEEDRDENSQKEKEKEFYNWRDYDEIY